LYAKIENIESGKMENREKLNDQRSGFIYMSAAKIRIPSADEKGIKVVKRANSRKHRKTIEKGDAQYGNRDNKN
jgi:hypothetical protein